MTITQETSVREVAASVPASVRLFEQYGIDYCCGGSKPLGEACQEKGISLEQFLAALQAAGPTAEAPRTRNWDSASLAELIAHILEKHHNYLRTELPRLTQLLSKVVEVHGGRQGESLHPLQDVYSGLRKELEQHMRKEENILFPFIQQIERAQVGAERLGPRGMSVQNPIGMMEQEHESAGNALRALRRLTADYTVPADGCPTYRALFDGLRALEADLHEHIHLENNILFPKAVQLESLLQG